MISLKFFYSKANFILLFIFSSINSVNAQNREGFFIDTINYVHLCNKVLEKNNNGLTLIGNNITGISDLIVLNLDSLSNVLWCKRYTTPSGFIVEDAIRTYDGGSLITGYFRYSNNPVREDAQIIKLDSSDDLEWAFEYDGLNDERFTGSIQLNDSIFLIFGESSSITPFNSPFVIRVDLNGNIIRSKTFAGSGYYPTDCIKSSDSGYVVLCSGSASGLVKFDSNDSIVWIQNFSAPSGNFLSLESLVETIDKGYMITGAYYKSADTIDALVLKTDSLGNIIWNRILDVGPKDGFKSVIRTIDSFYVAVGSSDFTGYNYNPAIACKMDEYGNFLWKKLFADSCYYKSVLETSNGYYVGGDSRAFSSTLGGMNIYLGLLDLNGNICTGSVDSGNISIATITEFQSIVSEYYGSLIVDDNLMPVSGGLFQYESVCANPPLEISNIEPIHFQIRTHVNERNKFSILFSENNIKKQIQIFDLRGKCLRNMVIEKNISEVELDLSLLESSIYILIISDSFNSLSRKIPITN